MRHHLDFRDIAAVGKIPGCTTLFKFGQNPDVGTTPNVETVWTGGGDYVFQSAASTLSITSASANDTADGTGARTVIITGLDSDYNQITETVTLNGTTPVVTTKQFLRHFRALVVTAGSSSYNEGAITGMHNGNTAFIINATEGQTLMAVYTVPANHTLLLYAFVAGLGKQSAAFADFHFEVRPFGGAWNIKQVISINTQGGSLERRAVIPFVIPEKADIRISVHDCSTNNCVANASFDGILISDTILKDLI